MRFPRWLVLSLIVISCVATLSFATWWWLTWPGRTIRDFTTLVQQGRFQEANRLLTPPDHWRVQRADGEVGHDAIQFESSRQTRTASFTIEAWQTWCTLNNLQTEPQSIEDLLLSRQQFSFHREFVTPFYIGGHASRGTIVLRCEPWAASAF